jgi:hypothetical protein
MAAKKKNGPELGPPIVETGWPDGFGPAWVSRALGRPGVFTRARRYVSDDGDQSTVVVLLRLGDDDKITEHSFRPASKIATRRFAETLIGLGVPVPYYSAPDLARLGAVIGKIASKASTDETPAWLDAANVIAALARRGIDQAIGTLGAAYVLRGREGRDVRGAISHIRDALKGNEWACPLIYEPARGEGGVLLIPSTLVNATLRDKLGTLHDAEIGFQLERAGLTRHRLAARTDIGRGTVEMRCWMVPNAWQDLPAVIADAGGDSGPSTLKASEAVGDQQRARARGRGRTR